MKLIFLTIILVLSVGVLATDELEAEQTFSDLYPCKWVRSLKVTKIEDDVFQCIKVNEKSNITYHALTTTSDSFQVFLLDDQEYANFLEKRPYRCINDPQCRLKDRTIKTGSYIINDSGKEQDFFVVVRNGNIFERSFVDVAITILPVRTRPPQRQLIN